LNEISILNDEKGRPYYELSGKAKALQKAVGMENIDLSLSHCKTYAVAFACGQCDVERKG
jgi:NAD(P)H-hydrate epimerase